MRWLVGLCVRYAGAVATLTLIALLAGLWATRNAPLDVFPEFVPSTVDIQTEAPGFTAQQVEQLVTKPIENAVNGATGLATIRSGIHSRPVGHHHPVHRQYRSLQCAPGHLRALERAGLERCLPAWKRRSLSPLTSSTMDLLKIGLALRQARSLSAARPGRLGDEARAAGGAGRGACDHVWRRGAPDPDPARPRDA